MEQILSAISRELSSARHGQLKASVDQTADFLRKNDESMLREPPYMLRAKVTDLFKDTLKLGSGKVSHLTAQGLQKLLREDRFADAKRDLQEDEEFLGLRMPSQVVSCLSGGVIVGQAPDVQRDLMRILLCLSCEYPWALTYRVLTEEYALCLAAYASGLGTTGNGGSSAAAGNRCQVRAGAQSAFCHSLRAYAQYLGDQWQTMKKNGAVAESQQCPLLDVVPMVKFLSLKIKEHLERWKASTRKPQQDEGAAGADGEKGRQHGGGDSEAASSQKAAAAGAASADEEGPVSPGDAVEFTLAALEALLDAVDSDVSARCPVFIQVLWQHTCPVLVASLGTPVEDVGSLQRAIFGGNESATAACDGNFGQGSGGWGSGASRKADGTRAKAVYNIALRLVTLVGSFRVMRPVLESLYHRMLLYPAPSQRSDPVRCVKDFIKDPVALVRFAGPILVEDPSETEKEDGKARGGISGDDLSLLIMAIHAADEMSAKCPALTPPAVGFVTALLASMEVLSSAEADAVEDHDKPGGTKKPVIPQEFVEKLNASYGTIASADYEGPLTYEKWTAKLASANALGDSYDKSNGQGSVVSSSASSSEVEDPDELDVSCEDADDGNNDEEEDDVEKEEDARSKDGDEDDAAGDTNSRQKGRLLALRRTRESASARGGGGRRPVDLYHEAERRNARRFADRLAADLLPSVSSLRTCIEVDEAVQRFASGYATSATESGNDKSGGSGGGASDKAILNADGVYLAVFSCLSLSLKLSLAGFYRGESVAVPLTEDQFVDEVQCNGGVLVYLSSTWLAELYQITLTTDFLATSSSNNLTSNATALTSLLTDLDGLGSCEVGSQMLSDFRKLVKNSGYFSRSILPSQQAGMKLARRILTGCWPSVFAILSRGVAGAGVDGAGNGKRGKGKARDVVVKLKSNLERLAVRGGKGWDEKTLVAALEGLQCSARLCNILGFQAECGAVFELLASASCSPSVDASRGIFFKFWKKTTQGKNDAANTSGGVGFSNKSGTLADLGAAQTLSVEVMLTKGLELGSHCPDCWPHLFRCVLYVNELESKQFHGLVQAGGQKDGMGDASEEGNEYLALPAISIPVGAAESGNLASLSLLVERLFSDAATKLNLESFREFLTALVVASRRQLFPRSGVGPWNRNDASKGNRKESSGKNQSKGSEGQRCPLLIHSLSDVVLKAVRSGRPLVHIMKAWSISGPHFMEAACHLDPEVAKGAVSSIHDVVSMLLSQQVELPGFHFQEALFKPFENLLQLELIEMHIQDQIVSSICEFVECYGTEIRSGWRPLFGALRAVKPQAAGPAGGGLARVLSDVFSAFFGAESPQVVANALLDCNLCLFKHVTEVEEEVEVEDGENGFSALHYLRKSSRCLAAFRAMAAPPTFHSAHRVKAPSVPKLVSTVLEYRDAEIFRPLDTDPPCWDNGPDADADGRNLHCRGGLDSFRSFADDEALNKRTGKLMACFVSGCGDGVTLESLDTGHGLFHIWYALIEGMMGSIPRCSKRTQSRVLFALFEMLEEIFQVLEQRPFALYCVNHLVLPWCQDWLRRHSPPVIPPPPSAVASKAAEDADDGYDDFSANAETVFLSQFKQCSGLLTDLVAGCVKTSRLESENLDEVNKPLDVLLNQTLVLLVELCNHPKEGVARIGCACFRHLVETAGPCLGRRQWDLVAAALFRALALTVRPVVTMIRAFKPASTAFYGDVGQIKVMARRDASVCENAQLRRLTAQVFLLESQVATEYVEDPWPPSSSSSGDPSSASSRRQPSSGPHVQVDDGSEDPERSYVFLLCPPCTSSCCSGPKSGKSSSSSATTAKSQQQAESDLVGVVRVPFAHVVVGLVAHQLLLQNLARLLLAGSSRVVPSLANTCLSDVDRRRAPATRGAGTSSVMPGFLSALSEDETADMLEALRCSQAVAMAFDSRPGLKFLLQKVGCLRVACNLYRQTGAAWTVRFSVAVERFLALIVNRQRDRDDGGDGGKDVVSEIRSVLRSDARRANTVVAGGGGGNKDDKDADDDDEADGEGGGGISYPSPSPPSLLPPEGPAVIFAVRDAFRSAVEAYVDLMAAADSSGAGWADGGYGGDDDDVGGTGGVQASSSSKSGIFFLVSRPGDLPMLTTLSKPTPKRPSAPSTPNKGRKDDPGDGDRTAAVESADDAEDARSDAALVKPGGDAAETSNGEEVEESEEKEQEARTEDNETEKGRRSPDSKLYDVVTSEDIEKLRKAYAKRKMACSFRSAGADSKSGSVDSASSKAGGPPPSGSLSPGVDEHRVSHEVREERETSILKDKDARMAVWSEILTSAFDLMQQVSEEEFCALLPCVFSSVLALLSHAAEAPLRQTIADFLQRVSNVYGFSPDA